MFSHPDYNFMLNYYYSNYFVYFTPVQSRHKVLDRPCILGNLSRDRRRWRHAKHGGTALYRCCTLFHANSR